MRLRPFIWPTIGFLAVAVCLWLLYHDLRNLSLAAVASSLEAISVKSWALAAGGAVLAYTALAGYDRVALNYLGKPMPWLFIVACSFTAYAVGHNVGASVFSGGAVRYRAYSSQGLSVAEVGALVALCSFTFGLGTTLLGGIVLLVEPGVTERFVAHLPFDIPTLAGVLLLGFVLFYAIGGWLRYEPIRIGKFHFRYPPLPIIGQQLIVAPLELVGAASIIYFALPEAGNPGFVVVLGIFLASFSVALISHAPGGLGVLEFVFLTGLPEIDPAAVLAALLIFRLFYLLIPLAFAIAVILLFERSQLMRKSAEKATLRRTQNQ